MSELKESFLADIIRGDYLPNSVGTPVSFLQSCLSDNDMESFLPEDWTFSTFDKLYGIGGSKSWLLKNWVTKNLPRQFEEIAGTAPKNSEADCLKIVKGVPELRQCLEYADHLRELFQRQINDIREQLSSEPNELLVKKAAELILDFNERRHQTGFDPEQDPEYKKRKATAEASIHTEERK